MCENAHTVRNAPVPSDGPGLSVVVVTRSVEKPAEPLGILFLSMNGPMPLWSGGVGPGGVTFTVTVRVTDPCGFVAVSVYVVVAAGCTLRLVPVTVPMPGAME